MKHLKAYLRLWKEAEPEELAIGILGGPAIGFVAFIIYAMNR